MLVYLCNGLQESDLGPGGECFISASRQRVDSCTRGSLVAGWAVGGSVSKLYVIYGFIKGKIYNIKCFICLHPHRITMLIAMLLKNRILFILIMLLFQLVLVTMSLL